MPKALYICYFGIREPLVQTQVIPYLMELAKDGHEISLLTFEPLPPPRHGSRATPPQAGGELSAKEAGEGACGPGISGIEWHWLRYHKWPSVPATLYDIAVGAWTVRRLLREHKFDILHCRVHHPLLMAVLARRFSRAKPKLLFDIRGFFPEEYVDAGIWKKGGWLFRSVKRVERWLMKEADGFVVLTEKAREILFPESRETGLDKFGRPVEVIPCCIDLDRFESVGAEVRAKVRSEIRAGDRRVIAYVGSFGGWYLSKEMIDLFEVAKRIDPTIFILILTQRDVEKVRELMKGRGFAATDYIVLSVEPSKVADYLSAADLAISFIKPCYSKLSSSPTKNAEYLACGLPMIANRGVGDVDSLIEENGVGVLVDDLDERSYVKALEGIRELGDIGDHCRQVGRLEFDLETVGGSRYRRLYKRLLTADASENGEEE